MELNEGLAEYTGMRLRGTRSAETRAALALRTADFGERASYPKSFAYETGPAYGLLADALADPRNERPSWREGLTQRSSLSEIVAAQVGYRKPAGLDATALRAARRYGYAEALSAETLRERIRATREAAYLRLLVTGPVLRLPIPKGNYSYDPNDTFSLGRFGTVFPQTTVEDEWGRLVATQGALLAVDSKTVWVMAPKNAKTLVGPGWTLTLSPGWHLRPTERAGSYEVVPGDPKG